MPFVAPAGTCVHTSFDQAQNPRANRSQGFIPGPMDKTRSSFLAVTRSHLPPYFTLYARESPIMTLPALKLINMDSAMGLILSICLADLCQYQWSRLAMLTSQAAYHHLEIESRFIALYFLLKPISCSYGARTLIHQASEADLRPSHPYKKPTALLRLLSLNPLKFVQRLSTN